VVRSADELHDALAGMVLAREHQCSEWSPWFSELVESGRGAVVRVGAGECAEEEGQVENLSYGFWIAAECWPIVRAIYPDATVEPAVVLPERLDKAVESADAMVEIVRGQMSYRGPVTAGQLAAELGLGDDAVSAALEALEGRGIVLRGQFTSPVRTAPADRPHEWCDRRLLARIHRLTLDGLRRRIQPVTPEEFIGFLVGHHRLQPDHHWIGQGGVREAIAQLQGFDMPAGVWEEDVFARRVLRYDKAWLDQLFLSGEVAWGRLRPVRREDEPKRSAAAISRTVPISLMLRRDLPWLAGGNASAASDGDVPRLTSNAEEALEALRSHGALFFQELAALTRLLPTHLENALRELAAVGLVTSDAFAAIRNLVHPKRTGRRRDRRRLLPGDAAPAGRWARFAAHLGPQPSREAQLESWCRQLLLRYGVLFRDLLARESAAPPWRELAPVLRRMELRGQVRGGRFVSGVGGEQYADETVIERLRASRDTADDSWIVISAADPLNLTGIVTREARIPSTHKNALILQRGRCVAAKVAGEIEFFAEQDTQTAAEMRRALQTGRRVSSSHLLEEWLDEERPRVAMTSANPKLPSRTMRRI
jgi:ATP-dependent Lhr-like helicase